jgi:hypothetical protein
VISDNSSKTLMYRVYHLIFSVQIRECSNNFPAINKGLGRAPRNTSMCYLFELSHLLSIFSLCICNPFHNITLPQNLCVAFMAKLLVWRAVKKVTTKCMNSSHLEFCKFYHGFLRFKDMPLTVTHMYLYVFNKVNIPN